MNAADRTTKHLVSKANATMAKVSHIVDLPDLNDNEFHEQNRKAMKDINQTIEKLHTFDREQTNALKTAENDLETMQKYISRLEKMYTGPKIEITSYQKGAILKPDEMDTLSGNQETAMGVMLKKVGDKEDTEMNTLADPDRTKKLAAQKVSKKVYSEEELEKLEKKYTVYNDTVYRAYIDGNIIVKLEPTYTLPEDVEKSEWEKYLETGLEFAGVYDAVRAGFGYDLATGEIVSVKDRFLAGFYVTPFGKAFKYGKRGYKLFKGEESAKKIAKVEKGAKSTEEISKVQKGEKTAEKASKVEKSTKSTKYVNNIKGLADDIGNKLDGSVSNAKGKGYKVNIPNGNKTITVRIMDKGSGGRDKPYFRVSVNGKGSITLDGKISNDRALTHIDITDR